MRAIRPRTRGAADESVVYIDTDSAPRIFFYGEDFLLEDLPVGTRVIYPRKPLAPLPNPRAAIRYAITHPHEAEPLHAQLRPGLKVTIAIDDISVAVGLNDWEGLKAHRNPGTIKQSWSYMDPNASEMHRSCCRLGKIVDEHLNVFHIETALNNRMFSGPMDFLLKNEDDFGELD